MNTITKENLGPVELGKDEDWTHIRRRNPDGTVSDIAYCGEDRSNHPYGPGPYNRYCPDCVRIRRERCGCS